MNKPDRDTRTLRIPRENEDTFRGSTGLANARRFDPVPVPHICGDVSPRHQTPRDTTRKSRGGLHESMQRLREAVRAADLGKRQSASVVYVNPVVEKSELRTMLMVGVSTNRNTPPLRMGDTVDVWATIAETKRIVRDANREAKARHDVLGMDYSPRYEVKEISTERTRVRRVQ